MPRPGRIFGEGAIYHVYNRLARGEQVFVAEDEAGRFVQLLREVVRRDEVTVFAWCLMSNHYHLALRTGAVSLDRPMRSLQQRVTRSVNARRRVHGPLWQGRYRAKLVDDQRYLDSLLVYIHLNPVTAGVVDDPAEYRWSGHRELVGMVRDPIVDVDEVLRVFGTTRRVARAAYVRRLKGAVEEEWVGEAPGRLPWWRLGRPPKGEDEDPDDAIRRRKERGAERPEWRPHLDAGALVEAGARVLDMGRNDLRSRRRDARVVRARELLMLVGVERYRLRVVDLAEALGRSPDGMTKTLARATRRRSEDPSFLENLETLDQQLAEAGSAKPTASNR
jgi:REP element-mobilizing transposase RayT